uniref:Uncharacterized protein n=1 Tax=Zea mays TaxID=4577 RepID=C0HGF5_MAIZE|nr:unknown [Zea mays]
MYDINGFLQIKDFIPRVLFKCQVRKNVVTVGPPI